MTTVSAATWEITKILAGILVLLVNKENWFIGTSAKLKILYIIPNSYWVVVELGVYELSGKTLKITRVAVYVTACRKLHNIIFRRPFSLKEINFSMKS